MLNLTLILTTYTALSSVSQNLRRALEISTGNDNFSCCWRSQSIRSKSLTSLCWKINRQSTDDFQTTNSVFKTKFGDYNGGPPAPLLFPLSSQTGFRKSSRQLVLRCGLSPSTCSIRIRFLRRSSRQAYQCDPNSIWM